MAVIKGNFYDPSMKDLGRGSFEAAMRSYERMKMVKDIPIVLNRSQSLVAPSAKIELGVDVAPGSTCQCGHGREFHSARPSKLGGGFGACREDCNCMEYREGNL